MASPNIEKYPEEDGAIVVATGAYARVLLFGEAREEFELLMTLMDADSVAACRNLKAYYKRYADHGPTSLSDSMFKSEKRQRVLGTNVPVYAFKAKHVRVYGVQDNYRGFLCFCGTSYDPSKKQRKADPEKLKKAAKEWLRITNDG
ncbi:hypothetical protein [Agrobacterium pusense]|uniref:hypothetical protein n=1 Tax=Agrobacterium pusense TaxID=648995 RepID=UPI0015732093|nr:hypothetical protein [Agrobacterium pusense]NTE81584.1 hypothetical protein [Agrobacterium tumefaciens]